MLTDHFIEFLASLGEGANLGGQVEIEPADKAERKSLTAGDSSVRKMGSPGADGPAVNVPEIDKPDADAPGAKN